MKYLLTNFPSNDENYHVNINRYYTSSDFNYSNLGSNLYVSPKIQNKKGQRFCKRDHVVTVDDIVTQYVESKRQTMETWAQHKELEYHLDLNTSILRFIRKLTAGLTSEEINKTRISQVFFSGGNIHWLIFGEDVESDDSTIRPLHYKLFYYPKKVNFLDSDMEDICEFLVIFLEKTVESVKHAKNLLKEQELAEKNKKILETGQKKTDFIR